MNNTSNGLNSSPRVTTGRTRRQALMGLMAMSSSSIWLAACGGGGGGVAGVSSGGTGAFNVGVITGLGSIILNGVRYDDSTATILDDDGNRLSRSDLRIGLVASVQTGAPAVNGSATASQITAIASELKGPVDSINVANNSFVVLGQTVTVNAATVYQLGLTGLSNLAVNNLVEVHGFTDAANNSVQASLIERKTSLSEYRMTGRVSNLTATTFQIGSLTISFSSADLRITPVTGLTVRVRMQTTPSTGIRIATRIKSAEDGLNLPGGALESEIQGTITEFASLGSFKVNGIPVTTSGSTTYPDGSAGIQLGARVEVKGSLSAGVVAATRVKLEDQSDIESVENELRGAISAMNTAAKTFVVRGVVVDYSSSTVRYDGGTSSSLADGRLVEVKGRLQSTNSQLLASRIKFEN